MHIPGVESVQRLGFVGLVRAEASMAASAYQVRFFCVSRPAANEGESDMGAVRSKATDIQSYVGQGRDRQKRLDKRYP